ncbi:hypothetical protein B0H34DRAFT_678451 [Crassisporium funariophilum]|nr:hypothetical protein B0H34DRAFT_678451 [Crassisporium funariophilum]
MAYTHNYVPSNVIFATQDPSLGYYPAYPVLPSEATSSAQYLYGPVATGFANNVVNPSYTTPRRRSSHSNNAYAFPTSLHDTARSPTRSRFNIPQSHAYVPETTPHRTPTRARLPSNGHGLVGPERHHRTHERSSRDENSHVITRPKRPTHGPSNHILIPQGLIPEPASSKDYYFRYPDINFRLANFPEFGVRVDAITRPHVPAIEGADDPVLKDVAERELKIQVVWPGYSTLPFEKRIKTVKGSLSRHAVLVKLAHIMLDFSIHIKQSKARVERGQESWAVSGGSGPGISCADVFITKLIHCGGSHWQMELWAPKDMF